MLDKLNDNMEKTNDKMIKTDTNMKRLIDKSNHWILWAIIAVEILFFVLILVIL